MKPHRFSEILGRLVEAILPGASAGRQREEFAQVVYDYIQPEHGNRGEEIEALVLVRAESHERLRAAITDISAVHDENQDGDGVPTWECPLCGRKTVGGYESPHSLDDLHHYDECPVALVNALCVKASGGKL